MLGTRDGTLRELEAAVGADNLFLFGLGPLETHAWREGHVYRPQDVYAIDPLVRLSLDALVGSRYAPVARRLRLGEGGALRPARPLARARRPRRLRPPPGRGARRVRRPAHLHREGDPDARAHAPLLGGAAHVSGFARDLAHALRALARSPGFALSVVLSLAIGIGANAAVFSVASALLLRPLPYADAERLVILWNRSPGLGIAEDWFSTAQYFDVQAGHSGFEELAIAIGANYNLTGDGAPERVGTIRASANLLPMLGARAAHGRLFGPQDATPGTGGTAVLAPRDLAAPLRRRSGRRRPLAGPERRAVPGDRRARGGLRPPARGDADARRRAPLRGRRAAEARRRRRVGAQPRGLQHRRQAEAGRVARRGAGGDGPDHGRPAPRPSRVLSAERRAHASTSCRSTSRWSATFARRSSC